MAVTISPLGSPLTEQNIKDAESRLGVEIPAEYRAFLLRYNGGSPTPNCFQVFGDSGQEVAGCLVGFFAGLNISRFDYYNLEWLSETYLGRIPSTLLPVGYDAGGNVLCISMRGEDTGAVYFWDHEAEELDGEAPTFDNMVFFAPSLEAFLAGMHDL